MRDDNPQELLITQSVRTTGINKQLLLIIGVFATMILSGVFIYSLSSTPESNKGINTPQKEQKQSSQEVENLMDMTDVGYGVAKQAYKEGLNSSISPVLEPSLTPDEMAFQQQKTQIEQLKFQRAVQAVQSPLNIITTQSQSQMANDTQNVSMPSSLQTVVPTTSKAIGEQNDRIEKEDFAKRAENNQWSLPYERIAGSVYELKTGTIIPSIMLTAINSDLPGQVIGHVSRSVYDSKTGRHLLIPAGSKLFGMYDSRVVMGQNRILLAFQRIIFPDGSSITLDSMPATDQAGQAGFHDKVNNHYFRIFGSAAFMALISGGMAYSLDSMDNSSDDDNPTVQNELASALAAQLGQTSMQLLQQHMTTKPTLNIRTGYRFNIVLVKDIQFKAPYQAYNNEE